MYKLCQGEKVDEVSVATLRAALDAVAFASMPNRENVSSLAVQAWRSHGQALKHFSLALRSMEDAIRGETLGEIVMFMLFEDIKNERQSLMSTHVTGIQHLLKLRGSKQLSDPATRSLFHFAFTQKVWAISSDGRVFD